MDEKKSLFYDALELGNGVFHNFTIQPRGSGRNLYYEQLERECDPELLHLHLSKYEAALLSFALSQFETPGFQNMKDKVNNFLHEKGILKNGD